MRRVLLFVFLFYSFVLFSQEINKISFLHWQDNDFFRTNVNILIEPISNGKAKISVHVGLKKSYISIISKRKYLRICKIAKDIKGDPFSPETDMSTEIRQTKFDIYYGSDMKRYFQTDLNKRSQKEFLYATKLIIRIAKLQMRDLVGYRL